MTVSINYFGNASFTNAISYSNSYLPHQVFVDSDSSVSLLKLRAYKPYGLETALVVGNFTYDGMPSTADRVSGSITSLFVQVDGTLLRQDSFTKPVNMQQWIFPSKIQANYLYQANILDQGVNFVGSQGGQEYGDTLIAGTGKDSFTSFAGKTTKAGATAYFDGKEGVDLAILQGIQNDYKVQASTFMDQTDMSYKMKVSGWQVTDSVTSRNGVTQLTNVERLQFTDTNLALDVGPTQNAGSVYMLYKAAFNRAPDNGGMGYWLAQKDSGKDIVTSLAQGFVGSKEFTDKYGTNPSNASYVDKLYQNVLGRAGESGGVAYWNQELDAGRMSKAAVLVQFATLAEGAANVASLIANGIPYTEYVG